MKTALKIPRSSKLLSGDIPACVANTELCNDDSGFTISMWYSLRPDGGLEYKKSDGCVLLSVGDDTKRMTKV